MPTRAFRVAYDGAGYHGFQRQPDVPTVDDAVLDALRALDVLGDDEDVPPGYAAAGRTDAGVSALAQTVAFEAPDWLTPDALNSELPRDVRAWAHADTVEGFHATHDAIARTYRYHLHAPGAAIERARAAATALTGDHDVHNLTTDDEGTERTVERLAVEPAGDWLVLTVTAPGFCRHQVRRTATVVRRVATGEREPEYVDRVLGEAELTGREGIPPAPAHPLALLDVEYPLVRFEVDADAAESVRDVFEGKRVEHRERARVAGDVAEGVGEE
jgi:tRNA pseudouridine38-40 synthase